MNMSDPDIPYQKDYDKLKTFRNINNAILVFICAFSIVIHILKNLQWLNYIYISVVMIYFIYNSMTEIVTYPDTAVKRRKGFIDNSLGTKLLEIPNVFCVGL